MVSDEMIVQFVAVTRDGATFLLEVAVEQTSIGEIDLSVWDEDALGGVLGPEELVGGD